jgi:hypothetical protein
MKNRVPLFPVAGKRQLMGMANAIEMLKPFQGNGFGIHHSMKINAGNIGRGMVAYGRFL